MFVCDGHWRKSLAAVRSLGRAGLPVAVGEANPVATALFSRYASYRYLYPSPRFRPQAFIEWLATHLKRRSYRLLLPMESTTLGVVLGERSQLQRWTALPFVSRERWAEADDKGQMSVLARSKGVPVPDFVVLDKDASPEEAAALRFPLVVKPCRGSGSAGLRRVSRREELVTALQAAGLGRRRLLVQEAIPGGGEAIGVSLLYDTGGRAVAAFSHRRLREFPVSGGPSTLRESIPHGETLDAARLLLEALDWVGPAMVEFKVDPRTGTPYFLEINPRFWGSLALAIHAGVDFPGLLYRLAGGERPSPVFDYTHGVTCRWLLPGDLLHWLSRCRTREVQKSGNLCSGSFWGRVTAYDIISLRDPGPMVARVASLLTIPFDRELQRVFWRQM